MEQRTARNWYWWLWLSPLITVPSLFSLVAVTVDGSSMSEGVAVLLAVLGSSLWHLILLFPALNKKSEFVRWHGRQALLLAGVRTAVPLGCLLVFGFELLALCSFPVLIVVWLFGTLLGQIQAAHGKCSLMRWFGRAEAQPSRLRAEESAQEAESGAEALVEVIRYGRDPEQRREALSKLEELGMVEPL